MNTVRGMVVGRAAGAAVDGVKPFKKDDTGKNIAWIGPRHVGCCVIEFMGPMHLGFYILTIVAVILLIVEMVRGFDVLRLIVGLMFIAVCCYLSYVAKATYILKAFKKEIERFSALNDDLEKNVKDLEGQNKEYSAKNEEHQQLNDQLNTEIKGLRKVEDQLRLLSEQCGGNIEQATKVLEGLERNVKLLTVNSVFQFFNTSDYDRSGKVDGEEVSLFVDNLGNLWRDLDKQQLKETILEQGGITLAQVRNLVEVMMLDPSENDKESLAKKLQGAFARSSSREMDESSTTIQPGRVPKEDV